MTRFEIIRRMAAERGKSPPTGAQIIDRCLARAGMPRSERRQLIAFVKRLAQCEKA